ncbi:MAG TPA: VWA domain-containing protein [Pyrinomonadaceae bacterium]
MKPLRRTIIQAAILFSLAFILTSLHSSLSLAQQKQDVAPQTLSSRRRADSVMLTVTVTDRRRNYVKGLTQFNFTVSDGKQEQQINAFSASDVPLSVGILLDTSMSVENADLKSVRSALGRFFQLSDKTNEYFLIGFGNQPKLLQDWTSDAESILKHIGAVRLDEATALYDACHLALKKFASSRHQKHAIILISDGGDTISERSFVALRRSLEESDALLYSIGLQGRSHSGSTMGLEGQAVLDELSTTTGGFLFSPDGEKQLNAVFDMLAIEMRNQYTIGFSPTANDGKRHSLKVKVTLPPDAPRDMQSLTVRSRKSFYAKRNQP